MTDYYRDKQQLTDEQIAELAPEWATHYKITRLDKTTWGIEFKGGCNFSVHFVAHESLGLSDKIYLDELSMGEKTIPSKKFDIDLVRREIHKTLTCDNSEKFMKYEDLPGYTIESYDKLIDRFKLTAEDLK